MSVYFAYRSHYEGPACKRVKRFKDATLLDWFRNHWRGAADDEAHHLAERLLGGGVYGFGSLFQAIAEHDLAPPRSEAELVDLLQQHLYVEGEILHRPHALQVLTDDDELMMAYYFFDDHYLARHARRAAYLMHDDWQLPIGHARGAFKPGVATQSMTPPRPGPGTTYLIRDCCYDSGNLDDLGGYCEVFAGVRLPDLACHLVRSRPDDNWQFEMVLLRSQMLQTPARATRQEKAFLEAIREHPADDASWMAYSDWLQEQGHPPAGRLVLERALRACARYPVGLVTTSSLPTHEFGRGNLESARAELEGLVGQLKGRESNHDPRKSRVQVEDHVAQLGLHTDRWWDRRDVFHHWIFFDDLWAAAHPDLAHSLLRYEQRWDVLS